MGQGQPDAEAGATLGQILRKNRATVFHCDVLRHVQAQAGAGSGDDA